MKRLTVVLCVLCFAACTHHTTTLPEPDRSVQCSKKAKVYLDTCVGSVLDYCEDMRSRMCASHRAICLSNFDVMLHRCYKNDEPA